MGSTARPQSGFTLLEAVVGLAIVAIGFAMGFAAMPESLMAQQSAQRLESACDLAESLLAQAVQTTALAQSGTAQGFIWRIEAAPVAGALSSGGEITAETVRIVVTWPEGGHDRDITVQSVRLIPGAEPQ
jgi:general secretion pathway protein I